VVDQIDSTLVLSKHARYQLRCTLKNYCFRGYAPLGLDKSFWVRFAKGQIREVPIATWRLVCSWYPDAGKAIAGAL